MKTYAETKGKEPFDWDAFLQRALRDEVAETEWLEAKDLARSWITCATGNQCSVLPRDENGYPTDEIARKLGGDDGFYTAIKYRNTPQAIHYLQLIELHSAYLVDLERKRREEIFEKAKAALEEATS